jgi:hypothetical protein
MTDTNGWSKAELYVMKKLEELQGGQSEIHEAIDDLRREFTRPRDCAVHLQRLNVLDTRVNAHADDLKKMKGFRSQVIGGAAVLSAIAQYVWTKLASLF